MWLSFDGWVWGSFGEGEGERCVKGLFRFLGLCGGRGRRGLMRILGKLNQDSWDGGFGSSPTGWTKNYSDGRAESRPGTGLFAD